MKKVFIVTMLVVALLALTVSADALQSIVSSGYLRVGMDAAGYMPFEGTNSSGNWIGFDVDFARLMAKALGVKLQIVPTRWSGILPSLVSGKFDMIISAMTITPQRAIMVNFSIPYFTVGQEILYNSTVYKKMPTLKELFNQKNLKVAVQIGTTGDDAAKAFFKNARILEFASMDEAALQVALRKADIAVADSTYVSYMSKKYAQLSSINETLTTENYGIAMKQGEFNLLNWVNTFITYEKASGEWKKLYDKWFTNYKPNS
ncbi:transporter substrate-binding domain-containing protein [Mesoaciditoga lauensis]|uniref:transporter substrate-binding domain-containing protein n=1 Tax=Mesoaciditoga lauensis TaxID=1495039 RepID=UPI00055E226E|nr:transporter substrate-binding domain-containing protein [Mesoaciditoga lauensis]